MGVESSLGDVSVAYGDSSAALDQVEDRRNSDDSVPETT